MLLNRMFGYGKNPRRPLMPLGAEEGDLVMAESVIRELMEFEEKLAAEAGGR